MLNLLNSPFGGTGGSPEPCEISSMRLWRQSDVPELSITWRIGRAPKFCRASAEARQNFGGKPATILGDLRRGDEMTGKTALRRAGAWAARPHGWQRELHRWPGLRGDYGRRRPGPRSNCGRTTASFSSIRRSSELGWEAEVEFSLADLTDDERVRQLVGRSPDVRWTAYVLGAFFLLKEWFPDRITRGANIYIKSEIPMRQRRGLVGGARGGGDEDGRLRLRSGTGRHRAGRGLPVGGEHHRGIGRAESRIRSLSCWGSAVCLLPLVCQPCYAAAPGSPAGRSWSCGASIQASAGGRAEQDAARAAAFMAYKLICDWEGLRRRAGRGEPDPALDRPALERISVECAAFSVSFQL